MWRWFTTPLTAGFGRGAFNCDISMNLDRSLQLQHSLSCGERPAAMPSRLLAPMCVVRRFEKKIFAETVDNGKVNVTILPPQAERFGVRMTKMSA
jgi:hypothetical protein